MVMREHYRPTKYNMNVICNIKQENEVNRLKFHSSDVNKQSVYSCDCKTRYKNKLECNENKVKLSDCQLKYFPINNDYKSDQLLG